MKLYRLKNADEIASKLMTVEDDAEKWFGCTHTQWIQTLAGLVKGSTTENEMLVNVWVNENNEGKIDSYLVIQLPFLQIEDSATLIYTYSRLKPTENKEAFRIIEKWLLNNGVDKLQILASKPELYERYGFKTTKSLMVKELNG